MEKSSVSSLIRCFTPTPPSVSAMGGTGERGSAPRVTGTETADEDESIRRLILRFIPLPALSKGFASKGSLLRTPSSGAGLSGVLSLLSPVEGCLCAKGSNLAVRSFESGRLSTGSGAEGAVGDAAGSGRKIADTGLGLELLVS